ncbi:hypothetical protein GCK72_008387 [Caenorhabditis remanei]|uniref:Uncharacterized protein n=1 Tax=Caenorhabditis remanei TaxID=31234 RepID=A0A6A5GZJ8_CAERE|nr:hypothetical protein GCK72_008387 [Caenorhabditis remanei]KAF1760141.1 hypothetical protein GCK72_008387 [Caenorhabditis remanei]
MEPSVFLSQQLLLGDHLDSQVRSNRVDRHLAQLLSNDKPDASHESLALHVTGQLENRLQLIHTLRVGLRIVLWLLFKIHFSWWRVLEQIVKHELSGRPWEWNIEWSIDFDVSRLPIRILSLDGFHENWTLFDDFTILDDGWILRILEENGHFAYGFRHCCSWKYWKNQCKRFGRREREGKSIII